MKILIHPVNIEDIWKCKESSFDEMLKAVVDIERGVAAVDAEMHSDLESLLLENGSEQQNLWGLNLYPLKNMKDSDFIEYTSFINIRPSQNNRSMEVIDPEIRKKIETVVRRLMV